MGHHTYKNNERKSSIDRWVLVGKAFSTSVNVRSKKMIRNRVVYRSFVLFLMAEG